MSYFFNPNEELEAHINSFFEKLRDVNKTQFQEALSILLLGSLSRGEATWTNIDGRITLLSDIEFFTIYPHGFNQFEVFNKAIEEAACMVSEETGSSLFHVDNSWIPKNDIGRIERKLLTFDAQEKGIVVFGEDVKKLLPRIDLNNINLEDISDILTHRVFSILYYGSNMPHNEKSIEYRYLLAKNSLDLMTVMLAKNGILVSGFIEKAEAVNELSIKEEEKNFFNYCLSVKLGTKVKHSFTISEMENMFIYLCEELSCSFRIPVSNRVMNLVSITRRRAGMIRRAIITMHLPKYRSTHLKNMIQTYKLKQTLNNTQLLDNYVLHGYPSNYKRKV